MEQEMIKEGNIFEVNNLYETTFPKLTEQFFKVITTEHYFESSRIRILPSSHSGSWLYPKTRPGKN
jgi:hypothetical protein